jgi:predicted permease
VLETWIQDARYALRLLRRSPLFTLTAALSLAIGIGANTTIFSVASALLLRPLPGLADAGRLVDVGRTRDGRGFDTVSYPTYQDVRERATSLSGLYAIRLEPQPMSLAGTGGAESVHGTAVSGNYFDVLGTQARLGRLFTDADDRRDSPAVVISHELWQRRFASDPSIAGREVTISGTPRVVIGVAPAGFQGTTLLRSDLWVPLTARAGGPGGTDLLTERRAVWLFMGGRLKPGVTVPQANAEMQAIGETLAREYPDAYRSRGLALTPSAVIPGRVNMVSGFLALLMGIVSLVLLIACVNVAGMLLARAAARRREIAVRLAIGAGRARLVRQLLTETTVLFGAGCGMGIILSGWLTSLLLAVLPSLPMPLGVDITTDWRVVAFAIGLSLVAAVVSGLVPALQASRPDLVPSLKVQGQGSGSRLRLRNAFVVGQITLSLLLVIAAGLFLRALGHAASIQPGFDQTNVDVVSLDLAVAGMTTEQGKAFAKDMVERARALPGVRAAVLAVDLPLDGGRFSFGQLRLPGSADGTPAGTAPTDWNLVTPGFFGTLGVPLLKGRDFSDTDTDTAPAVGIVNQALARRLFGDDDPIGRQVEVSTPMSSDAQRITVVGVAADARFVSLGEAATPYFYAPLSQRYMSRVSLVVKSTGRTSIPQVRSMLRDMNPHLPVTSAMPLDQVTALGLIPQRIAASVAGTLGIVGLLLAAIGIYGVTSYSVSRRTREIGIRIALGADRANVLRLILRQGVLLTVIGVAIGLACAAAATRLLQNLLYGVSAMDPLTFAGTTLLFVIIAVAATYLPARRATRIDPMVALRVD